MEIKVDNLVTFLFAIVGVCIFPLGMIWAINSLFLLQIQYTISNWFAIVFIQIYFQVILKASLTNKK